MTSPCLNVVVPIIKQAPTVVGTRAFSESFKHVRRFSNVGKGPSTLLRKDQSNTKLMCNNVRNICGRENCADPCDFPRCSEENLAKSDCMKDLKEKSKKEPTVYELYWNRPECCNSECLDAFPRFDDLYYRESDKENRIYTQTWSECPPVVVKPKHICCTEKLNLPPLCKRPKKERPKTACGHVDEACPPELEGKCPKITLPCCRPARQGSCTIVKQSSDCKKFMAPSPSFSECRKQELKKRRITECWCLALPSMCQVWEEWRRLQIIKRQ